jgi:hypothetical protein
MHEGLVADLVGPEQIGLHQSDADALGFPGCVDPEIPPQAGKVPIAALEVPEVVGLQDAGDEGEARRIVGEVEPPLRLQQGRPEDAIGQNQTPTRA